MSGDFLFHLDVHWTHRLNYMYFSLICMLFLFAYLTRTGSRPKAQSLNLFPFPLRHNLQGLEVGLGDWECELGGLSLLQLEKLR